MNGARLSLVDPDGRQKAGFEDVEIRLTRTGERVTRLTVKGRTGQRWKELAIDLSNEPDGTQRAEIDIVRFEPAEVVALAMGTGALSIEGLPVRGKASLSQSPDGRKSIEARIDVLPGVIRFAESPIPPIAVDAAHIEVASSGDLSVIEIKSVELNAGATRLKGHRQPARRWRRLAHEPRGEGPAGGCRCRSPRRDRCRQGRFADRPSRQRGPDRIHVRARAGDPCRGAGAGEAGRRLAAAALLDHGDGFRPARGAGAVAALDLRRCPPNAIAPVHQRAPRFAACRDGFARRGPCPADAGRGHSRRRAVCRRRGLAGAFPARPRPAAADRRQRLRQDDGAHGQARDHQGNSRSRQWPPAPAQRRQLRRRRDLGEARPGAHDVPLDRVDGGAGRAVRLSRAEGIRAERNRSGEPAWQQRPQERGGVDAGR